MTISKITAPDKLVQEKTIKSLYYRNLPRERTKRSKPKLQIEAIGKGKVDGSIPFGSTIFPENQDVDTAGPIPPWPKEPDVPDTPLIIAADLVAAGHFDQALRLLLPLPDQPERHALLGAVYLGRKQAAAALRHLNAACQPVPHAPRLDLMRGQAHLLDNNPTAAIAILQQLDAAQVPEAPQILVTAYRSDAQYAQAIALIEAQDHPSDQMLYDLALCQGCLGHSAAALAAWDRLIGRAPQLAAAWYGSHGPALDLLGRAESLRRLEQAACLPRANGKYRGLLAAYDLLAGHAPRPHAAKHAHLPQAAAALLPHLAPGWHLFGVSLTLLRWAVDQARMPGLVLEFGVRRGNSLLALAQAAGQTVHGFDSFEGLPEAWGAASQGVLTTNGQLPPAHDAIRLHPGWFDDTLPRFLADHSGPVRLVNVDSDLYASANTVLTALAPRIQAGTILVFDEFIGNRTWAQDEYRAFQEFTARFDRRYEIIAVNPACKQVAVRMTN